MNMICICKQLTFPTCFRRAVRSGVMCYNGCKCSLSEYDRAVGTLAHQLEELCGYYTAAANSYILDITTATICIVILCFTPIKVVYVTGITKT